jgi:hypothetical protein
LQAIKDSILILPGQAHVNGSSTAKFKLQPQDGERSEAIFLRHGDQIHISSSASYLTCQWTDSQIQVNSSAAAGVTVTPEEETEDEGDNPEQPPINGVKSQIRATPQLSNQRSATIVQETPTAARVVENVPDSHETTLLESEAFSTARTGESQDQMQSQLPLNTRTSSPRVKIPSRSAKKRTLSLADEAEASNSKIEPLSGPTKRAKTSDSDTEDSRLSNVDVAKPKQPAPPRSQRNSQRSASATATTTVNDYNDSAPRVACSNSTITKASQAVKFLKKQGGVYVENLADGFDVLWWVLYCLGESITLLTDESVRDGDLQKTTKVLYAIACGIPIVTDQWLYDSALAKRLLAVSAFKPSIPKQEEEWRVKLDDILGHPQTPFADYAVHFTKSVKTKYASFSDIEVVCKAAGATSVTTGATKVKKTGSTIVLAEDGDDVEAQKLMKDGVACYTKDFFTYSILRGAVDLESDEFKIDAEAAAADTPAKEQKKKRGRKSG